MSTNDHLELVLKGCAIKHPEIDIENIDKKSCVNYQDQIQPTVD